MQLAIRLIGLLVGAVCGVNAMTNCHVSVRAEEDGIIGKGGNPPGEAVIFSLPVLINSFHLRFVDSRSGQQLVPTKVTLAYGWRWLEYPYPEHSWGAWSGASDLVECEPPSAELEIPEFEVRPRGWYDGKYIRFQFPKKPKFTGIAIVIKIGECTTRASITSREAVRLKGSLAVFKANCMGTSSILMNFPDG